MGKGRWRVQRGFIASNQQELIEHLWTNTTIQCEAVRVAMAATDRAKYLVGAGRMTYADAPQPIGHGATISAPHIHGLALSLLVPALQPGAAVLDVGCGSGYLCAVMARIVSRDRAGGRVVAACTYLCTRQHTHAMRVPVHLYEHV